MNADGPYAKETEAIIGCAFAVLNDMGHGFHEKPYENALAVEFPHRAIPSNQQPSYPLSYRNERVGEYIPDLIVSGPVIVDAKTIERITDHEVGRMLDYPKATGLQVGLILDFKHAKLQFRRVVRSSSHTGAEPPDLHWKFNRR